MEKVQYADEAVEIAVRFLKRHRHNVVSPRPIAAFIDQGEWIVEAEVWPFAMNVAKIVIDTETGRILKCQMSQSWPQSETC